MFNILHFFKGKDSILEFIFYTDSVCVNSLIPDFISITEILLMDEV